MIDPPISQQVNQWLTQLTTMSRNLMELSEAESTKIMRARSKDAVNGFAGVTKEKAARAVAMLDSLLEQYALLAHVVDEAHGLVSKGGIFRNYEDRIRELLNGQSVVVLTQQISVTHRGLLDDGNRVVRATPAEVLASMEQSFAEARDALAMIAQAIATVRPRLAVLRQEIAMLENWARTLGVERTTAASDLDQALSSMEHDPLGGATEVERIEDGVKQWRAELQAIDTEHKAILASIARGQAALTELQDLVARSRAAYATAREQIADPEGLMPPDGDSAVASLSAWLKALEQNAAEGRFAAVTVGMVKWERDYSNRLDAARSSYACNSALLDERDELRGRFKALCAKADALRSRGLLLGEAVDTASRQTKSVLDTVPFDMRTARRCVAAFEATVAANRNS